MNISSRLTQHFNLHFINTGKYRRTRLYIMHSLSNILHPRVFVFVLAGIAIILLTFLASNNAVEIAISGIASVFIGIGVNNYSMIEGHLKEERQIKMKTGQSVHILRVTNSMIADLHEEVDSLKEESIKSEFEKIDQFIKLGIRLLEDDKP